MRCVRCNREISGSAASIKSQSGVLHLGPVCAKKAGMQQKKERRKKEPAATYVDPNQFKLWSEI